MLNGAEANVFKRLLLAVVSKGTVSDEAHSNAFQFFVI